MPMVKFKNDRGDYSYEYRMRCFARWYLRYPRKKQFVDNYRKNAGDKADKAVAELEKFVKAEREIHVQGDDCVRKARSS